MEVLNFRITEVQLRGQKLQINTNNQLGYIRNGTRTCNKVKLRRPIFFLVIGFKHRSLLWLVESKPLPVSQREEGQVESEKRR
jgi:hypothetical protein